MIDGLILARAIADCIIYTMEQLRKGQIAFNELYKTDPEIADKIRGTLSDPFYNDSRLPLFEKTVLKIRSTRE